MSLAASRRGALDGLIVIDLTMMLAGPYATMMLADQGARVIKIEPPGGDNTRRIGPHLPGALRKEDKGYGGYFASINRNKESIVIDLKQPPGRELLLRLVREADVLVENYRAGVMERLGLAYESLAQLNPKLVYATVRGFGDARNGRSPYTDWPAYDPVSQAMGGIAGITSTTPGGPPTKIGPGVGDIGPAMFLAFGIASACWHAQRTGEGQFVDVSMVDGVLAISERIVFQYGVTREAPRPEGSGHPLLCPFGMFECADGHVCIGVPKDEFWRPFVECIGRPELADDPRYADNLARIAHRDEVEQIVHGWSRERTKAQIQQVLGGIIPFGPVMDAADIFADPHFAARRMLIEVEAPGAQAPMTIAGTPVKMQRTPGGVARRAPTTGEQTDAILAELGIGADEIATLRHDGIIA